MLKMSRGKRAQTEPMHVRSARYGSLARPMSTAHALSPGRRREYGLSKRGGAQRPAGAHRDPADVARPRPGERRAHSRGGVRAGRRASRVRRASHATRAGRRRRRSGARRAGGGARAPRRHRRACDSWRRASAPAAGGELRPRRGLRHLLPPDRRRGGRGRGTTRDRPGAPPGWTVCTRDADRAASGTPGEVFPALAAVGRRALVRARSGRRALGPPAGRGVAGVDRPIAASAVRGGARQSRLPAVCCRSPPSSRCSSASPP